MRRALAILLLAAVPACAPEPPIADAAAPAPPPPPALAPVPASASVSAVAVAVTSRPAEASSSIRYLALGDSFTIGTGSSPAESFPARLAERLRASGRAVVLENLGVNGFTTDDLLAREIPRVASFAPTLVTVAVGANDLVHGSPPDRYRAQVRRIFTAIAAAGVAPARVLALPQPDWSLSPVAADFGEQRVIAEHIAAFNDILREEAAAAGARYVDLFPLMQRQARAGLIAGDGLHPAARAYGEWAAELERAEPPR